MDLKRQVSVVSGNSKNSETLERAGVRTANAIIALSEDDVENLSVCLIAKKLNPNIRSIIQIFDSRLHVKLQDEMAIDCVLSMSSVAAPYFAAAVYGEKILLALAWKKNLVFFSQTTLPTPHRDPIKLGDTIHDDLLISIMPLENDSV
jgi:Trk K+ transport system NAD-binding subunit